MARRRWPDMLKERIRESTGLAVSIGVAANKTVAKIASDLEKPDGLVIVAPGAEAGFLAPLPVRALWGIGPKAEAALARAGVRTVGGLAAADPRELEGLFGSRGSQLQGMAQGRDPRPLVTAHERKSVGAESTFPRDLAVGPELDEQLRRVAASVARRLAREGVAARTVALKLRYSDFRTITRQSSRADPTDDEAEVRITVERLLARVARPGDRFRLVGIQCSGLVKGSGGQLRLWER